jgi:hypothetical protein
MTNSLKTLIGTVVIIFAALVAFALPAGAANSGIRIQTPWRTLAVVSPAGLWQTYGNNSEGDCVLAAVGNLATEWSPAVGNIANTAATVQQWWQAMNEPVYGLNPEYVLYYWETHPINGFTIAGFLQQTPNQANVEQDVLHSQGAFLTVYLGDELYYHEQPNWSTSNDSAPDPNLSHEVLVTGFNAFGVTLVSWGQTYTATWSWVAAHSVDLDEVTR